MGWRKQNEVRRALRRHVANTWNNYILDCYFSICIFLAIRQCVVWMSFNVCHSWTLRVSCASYLINVSNFIQSYGIVCISPSNNASHLIHVFWCTYIITDMFLWPFFIAIYTGWYTTTTRSLPVPGVSVLCHAHYFVPVCVSSHREAYGFTSHVRFANPQAGFQGNKLMWEYPHHHIHGSFRLQYNIF